MSEKTKEELMEENEKLRSYAERRTRELEKLLTLFNRMEAMLANMLDIVNENKTNLLEKIQKEDN